MDQSTIPKLDSKAQPQGLAVRISKIVSRYGWRVIVIVPIMAVNRWGFFESFRLWHLKLITVGKKGRRIRIGAGFRVNPGTELEVGDQTYFEGSAKLLIGPVNQARVQIGANGWISRGFHLSCYNSIIIGNEVLIGEYVSLRDSTHKTNRTDRLISAQGDALGTIIIEEGSWIGRGVLIQGKPGGTVIGAGAIVGANSVVVKSIPPMEIWGGVPARFIKKRM